MTRVLVTGATGCIGRHALPGLVAQGWDVHAVSLRQTRPAVDGVSWHRADLLDAGQVGALMQRTSPTHLLHLAWSIAPGRWADSPENFLWVQSSLELIRRFREQGGKRVVAAGSCLEYDWNYGFCSERLTPCVPHTAYGVCKHALQTLLSAWSASDGFSSAWGRVFFVYGPHEHPDRLVASVVRSLLNNEEARCSHGRQIRDYLFAEDVAEAFVALLASDVTGPVNIASGQPITLREIVLRIGSLLGRPELVAFGAIPPAATDVDLVVADVTRLTQTVGWQPRHDLQAGLMRTIDWWRLQTGVGEAAGQRR